MGDIYVAGWWMCGLNAVFFGYWMKDFGWLDGDGGDGCRVWCEMEVLGMGGDHWDEWKFRGQNRDSAD